LSDSKLLEIQELNLLEEDEFPC